jgi:nitrate/nitrite transport system substrate-binding protein
MTSLNRATLHVGYTPLSDCATLAVAQEMGFFSEQKLNVRLEPQSSWATSRDLLRVGALGAAHMLAPAPVAAALSGDQSIVAPMALSLNGNTIVVSREVFEQMEEANALAGRSCLAAAEALGAVMRERADKPLRVAAVFAESNHNLDLRRWLKAGGMTLDRDARIVIVPPGEVERCLERGLIDAFCVGEPYGSLAVHRGAGRIVASSWDLWSNRIEKVLAVNSAVAQERPEAVRALLRALIGAAQWADQAENRRAVANLLVEARYISAPIEVVQAGLIGQVRFGREPAPRANPDFLVLHRYAANFPWVSQARWFADALAEAGLADKPAREQPLGFRPDLYVEAARDLGVAYPLVERKDEGAHRAAWTLVEATRPIAMGPEVRFESAKS